MKDLGALKYFLDIKVAKNSEAFSMPIKCSLGMISEVVLFGVKPTKLSYEIKPQASTS